MRLFFFTWYITSEMYYIMNKRLGGLNADLFGYFVKITFAAFLTGILERWLWHSIYFSSETIKLFVLGFSGFIIYGLICYVLKIEQARHVWKWIKSGFILET